MSEATTTLEGWYALHDFRSILWPEWKASSEVEREHAIREFLALAEEWQAAEEARTGSTAIYSIVGQKADILMIHMRETLEELNDIETRFNKSRLADYCEPAYSYVSIVELSNYTAAPGENPMDNPEVAARLKPILPRTKHVCFYPMNKKRDGGDNWYMLSLEERREMMRAHGLTGRKYAGRVKQIVTGSVGLDDWEWGVTLFSDDALQFKKLVYEMRFDEVSARFGEFGEFFVGNLLDRDRIVRLLTV